MPSDCQPAAIGVIQVHLHTSESTRTRYVNKDSLAGKGVSSFLLSCVPVSLRLAGAVY